MNYKKIIAYDNQGIEGSGIVFFELEEKDQKPESRIAAVLAFSEKSCPLKNNNLPHVTFGPCIEHMYRGKNPIGDFTGMTTEELKDAIKQLEMVESEEWLNEQILHHEEIE